MPASAVAYSVSFGVAFAVAFGVTIGIPDFDTDTAALRSAQRNSFAGAH